MKSILAFVLVVSTLCSRAQPFLDLVNTRFLVSPLKGSAGANPDNTRLQYFNVATILPWQFKNSKDAIILSPVFEEWKITSGTSATVRGILLPLSFVKTAKNGKWSLLSTFIPRWNYSIPGSMINALQLGGAAIVTVKKDKALAFKFGLYYNKEFFGNFFMPLVGVEWRIDSTNRLFGVLPGNFVYEHKCSKHFYWGATFRAITNSYRLHDSDTLSAQNNGQQYLRIDDNQLGAYLDYYLTKHIVMILEGGHSILRKVRLGWSADGENSVTNVLPGGDAFFARLGVAYRIRL